MTAENGRVRAPRHTNVALFVPHAGCPHQCSFCNQRAISGAQAPLTPAEVADACRVAVATMPSAAAQAEIAFFGGSFTAIERGYMVSLLEAAQPFLRQGYFGGIRVSTRPDCVDADVLALLRRYGVTVVELGAQSMDDAVLAANRRGHTAAQVEQAAAAVRDAGLSLGLQMMTGLYGDTDSGALETGARLAALRPDTMRIYPTIVMRDTPLAELYASGAYCPPSLEEAVALCAQLLAFFELENGIPVIRLGLHAGGDVETGRVAGPWHPAFRELCEGQLYLNTARAVLKSGCPGRVVLRVHPAAVSKMVGQKRANIHALAAQGYEVTVRASEAVPLYAVQAEFMTGSERA